MSLKSGVDNPRSPLRRFLDRELSAGAKPLRESFRSQHRADRVLLPLPGVGTEGGTSGTAIDTRLRLAFTTAAPVDLAAAIGIEQTGRVYQGVGLRMRAVGNELAARLTHTVHGLDLANRDTPIDRAHDDEEDLARLLIAAAWYQVLTRNPVGFEHTPLYLAAYEDPGSFTLDRLLQLPHRDLVADVVAQLHQGADGPLLSLRARTRPEDCTPGPTFPGTQITADADLVVDGLLIDFKSDKRPHRFPKASAWQLLGYLLLDTADRYRIDTVGFYLSRSAVLASWPVEEYLDLLGTCRRDLTALRSVFAELLAGCRADAEPCTPEDEDRIRRLLQKLAPVIEAGHCPTCAQPLPESTRRPRKFCTARCRGRDQAMRRRGLLPGGPIPVLPRPRKERLEPGEGWQVVSLTRRFRSSRGAV
ncbi:hypothetical protein [Streptomyces turgidiscabies]|uniref:PD-(D/E)XK endonuclease-like domain-containing protein n=1 Tax=Streptomyces turgidiscabies TaxID=85558 RepID=A0ABU0RSZ7_9ACTN|nr:hypothetical protein [Streptomyces turgidiscabies]MDQ0935122.1 hypothetical protein [Streptomyces turgidiscabies]